MNLNAQLVIPIAQAKVHKKQQLMTPSLRFPLLAGGTEPSRFPSRSGGNLKEGGNYEPERAVGKCLCGGFSTAPHLTSPVNGGGTATPLSRPVGEGLGVRAYLFRRRSIARPARPAPNASMLAGSGSTRRRNSAVPAPV
jgi:hypothetical protein